MLATLPTRAAPVPAIRPNQDELIDEAFERFRETLECPVRLSLEIQKLETSDPIYVGGRWYPERTRVFARKALAARRVREAARQELHQALIDAAKASGHRHCCWCEGVVAEGQACDSIGGRLIHARPCLTEFDRFTRDRTPRGEG